MELTPLEKDSPERLDVAIETLASKTGIVMKALLEETDVKIKSSLQKELDLLADERMKMYLGDESIIEKILTDYSSQVRESMDQNNTPHAAE